MKLILRPLLGISWVVSVGVAIELSVRLSDLLRYGIPLAAAATSIEDLLVTDSLGPHGRAATHFERFRINNLGYRGPDFDPAAQRGPLVVVVGASESFGMAESAGMEWPRQLERKLRGSCDTSLTVLNASFAGVSLPTATQNLRRRIRVLRPDAVVYYPQPTQYLLGRRPTPSQDQRDTVTPLPRFRARAVPRLRAQVKNELPAWLLTALRNNATEMSRRSRGMFTAFPAERLDGFEEDLKLFVEEARASTQTIVFVDPQHRFDDTTSTAEQDWLRAWEKLLPRADASLLLGFSDSASQSVRAVARSEGVLLAEPKLGTGANRASMFSDPVHFSDAGAYSVAEAVAQTIRAALPCPTATGLKE